MSEESSREREGKIWTDWFDRPESRRMLWRALWATCALTLAAEFFVHRKGYFGIDSVFGFFAALGFLACAAMILGTKALGIFLKRGEDYYNQREADAESARAATEKRGGGDG